MMPIINRGTWTRVYAVRQIIKRFLAQYSGTRVNIVSLGAGYDTNYFWLKKENAEIDLLVDYIEVDFSAVVKKKSQTIRSKEPL